MKVYFPVANIDTVREQQFVNQSATQLIDRIFD